MAVGGPQGPHEHVLRAELLANAQYARLACRAHEGVTCISLTISMTFENLSPT